MSDGRRILIVEDDTDISMVEEAYLEAAFIKGTKRLSFPTGSLNC